METPWKAIGVVVAFVGGIFLAALVLANVARSQGGAYTLVPEMSGQAVISDCAPDVIALGLRQRCSGTVAWSNGSTTNDDDIFSPRDVTGRTVGVQQVSSFELKGGRTHGTNPPDIRTLTNDHPLGSIFWSVVAYGGPPALPFALIGVLWIGHKLFSRQERLRRRLRKGRRSPGT